MGRSAEVFISGVITIGIITALVMNGRNTANVIKSTGTAGSNLLGTAIRGR